MSNASVKTAPVTRGVASVPVVMQLEKLECGAACLEMIAAYYGKWLPIEQVRTDCGVSRDGSNALHMLKAARSYGFAARGIRYEAEEIRKSGTFPCIIHWNFNHFVVLDGFKRNKAVINDPARGKVRVSMEEFDASFTGVCLEFAPTPQFVPGGRRRSVLRFARERLKNSHGAFAFMMATSAVSVIIALFNPAFSRIFVDRLLSGVNPNWLLPFVGALLALSIVQVIVEAQKSIYTLKINGKFAVVASASFMWHVLRLPMEFFSQRMAGDIAERQGTNAGIAASLMNVFAPLLVNCAMLIVYLAVMLRYSTVLTAIGVASVALNMISAMVISKKRVNVTRVQMRDSGKLAGTTITGIEMIETIKASGAENGFFEKWAGYQANVNAASVRFAKINAYLGSIPPFVSSLSNIIVLMTAVMLTIQGRFTVGMILAFQGVMSQFMTPVSSLIGAGQSLQEMRTNMERVEDVMNYPTDVEYKDDEADCAEYDKLTGEIVAKNVTFGYSRFAKPIIEDFSLTLRRGSRIAIVGDSGCGKSTLSKLLSGLYKPWSGEILYDGKPIESIDRDVFTGSLAVVDQDIILFEDTVANNIKMWDSSIEDFEMILAARDAMLHDDIMQREGGYSAKVLEGGRNLSGGQRQRMEIARVLAQDPTIVILDEATSALDAKTEHEVIKSIHARGVTMIVIAHRLSTVRDCDEIIVLDDGKAVERGTHDELIAKHGRYFELVTNE